MNARRCPEVANDAPPTGESRTKATAMMASRHPTKPHKRHQRHLRILLVRTTRDIHRKIEGKAAIEEARFPACGSVRSASACFKLHSSIHRGEVHLQGRRTHAPLKSSG